MSSMSTPGESIAYRVIIVSVLGPVLAIPLCAIRVYTKLRILRNTGYDDYAIFFATLLALAYSITTIYQTSNGLGKHIADVTPRQFHNLMKIGGIAGQMLYNMATMFIKVSLCFFYLRFSISRAFHIAIYILMAISVIYSILSGFGFAWTCNPKEKYWDFTIMSGSCIDFNAFFLSNACINAATDFVLLVMPLFIIKNLTLPARRKLGVALLLMTGSFVFVVSLIRTEAIVRGMREVATDATWGMVLNFIWMFVHHTLYLINAIANISSLVEMWLGIICTCIPTLHTFIKNRRAARSTQDNANMPGHGMPEHQWIGLEDTPEKASDAKRSPRVDILDSKSHGSNSSATQSILYAETALPSLSHANTRSTTDLPV
ncbi:hypothetical protein yc1106_02770 [Curvularia clavata]|uniref:Rhodopsin domain-containing protein n=1 Tax=Curvularia clavata TaxID=95742 RepID=A0A9Q8Z408_CURCL|nr:hypothetical protein yc1106_02770 [Curvularia clavata]